MENSSNLFKYKISGASGFVMVLLVLVLIGLGERVLYDISRFFVGSDFNYFNDISTLLVHTVFVACLLVVAVIVNIAVSERKEKYAIVFVPYFVLAIALTLQVAFEASVYFYSHHTMFQFYLVMTTLVAITSMLIYFVQKRFVPVETTRTDGSAGSWTGVIVWILGLLIGVPLVLFMLATFFFRSVSW